MKQEAGQLLVEILLAVVISAVILIIGAQLIFVSLRSTQISNKRTVMIELAKEGLEAARAIKDSNDTSSQGWNRIYLPPDGTGNPSTSKGAGNPYHPVAGATWTLVAGSEDITISGEIYARKIIIDNVSRTSGNIDSTYNSANDDPLTQKITVTISAVGFSDVSYSEYISRWLNQTPKQTDWSSGVSCATVTSFGNVYCADDGNIDNTGTAGSLKLKPQ